MIPGVLVWLIAAPAANPVNGDRVALILVALISLAGLLYTTRSTRRTAESKVDAEAYQRARVIDEGVLTSLKAEIERLRDQVTALRAELAAEERAHEATKRLNSELRQRLHDVEQTVERMSRLLTAASIELPPSLDPRRGGQLGNPSRTED